jgi:hypothetical protein
MKRNLFITMCLLIGFTMLVAGCKKSELKGYDQPDMVYIYKDYFSTTNDSTIYSFAIKPPALTRDTIKIPVRIMGMAKDYDRTVNVAIISDSTTATADQHYELLPTKIKAGEYTGNIPVLVKRSSDLETAEVKMLLEVKESPDFKPGVPSTVPVNPRAGGGLQYKIRLNDILTKPSNWDTRLTGFFGTYSKVKYLFIINVTGVYDFPYGTAGGPSPAQMNYYNVLCKTALATYIAANGPLIDENGNAVTFP